MKRLVAKSVAGSARTVSVASMQRSFIVRKKDNEVWSSQKVKQLKAFMIEWKCREVKLHWGKEQVSFTCVFGASQERVRLRRTEKLYSR